MKLPLIVGLVALAAVLGVGMYTTEFLTYLGNNPTTCNNCHVMDNVYEGWYHGGHSSAAVCGDCHTPHALIPKYITKAVSGYHHVSAFVLGNIPDAIRSKESSKKIAQELHRLLHDCSHYCLLCVQPVACFVEEIHDDCVSSFLNLDCLLGRGTVCSP